ncbi:MAG: HXXEE domain-containing protein [Spirochaetes bacterium]|nr:HXXEE domain-containing protein [Spirochaetota bacterium]
MFEMLFLLGFTLHNIEEALWLPKWSINAGKFHPHVKANEFHFAVICVTIAGYLITFQFMVIGANSKISEYVYFGFLLMMSMNSLFPHLISAVITKKYAPGLLTGLLLNFPLGLYIVFCEYQQRITDVKLIISFVTVTAVVLLSLKPLFRLGGRIIKY